MNAEAIDLVSPAVDVTLTTVGVPFLALPRSSQRRVPLFVTRYNSVGASEHRRVRPGVRLVRALPVFSA
jgi:hypothetical protein